MVRYGLGVDTGGTFTDAVIMDLDDFSVISKAKARTTHHDLSIGLYESVDKVFAESNIRPSEITIAGVSTTLATNSVLEGKGGDVGLILIGWKPEGNDSFGEKNRAVVKGGYDSKGSLKASLDMDELKEAIKKISEGVDAIAISGLFAVVNPSQERTVKDLCIEMTGLPTVAGTELSSTLGVDERARTAVLNGRLISVVNTFFDDLEKTLRSKGLNAPIMVYKGDGSVMSIAKARKYPVESVFSGPAASSVGGRIISGLQDFIMVDIGGTSTDVALVDHGMPEIQAEGANVCGWRTHVKAVDMYTVALGGDSLIRLKDAKLDLGGGLVVPLFSLSRYKSFNFDIGPERVIPLSVICAQYPDVLKSIRSQNQCEFYLLASEPDPSEIDERTAKVVKAMKGAGPMDLLSIRDRTSGLWVIDKELEWLVDMGYVLHAGLTPSDLLVYNGCFENGDQNAPKEALAVLSDMLRMSPERIVTRLLDMVHSKIAEAIVTRLLDDKLKDWRSAESRKFVRELVSKKPDKGFTLLPRIDLPIIGIGAPTKYIMGDVGERLGAQLVFPENGDVGNAVGAVCSKMVESMTAVITPAADRMFSVSVPFCDPEYVDGFEASLTRAQELLKKELTMKLVKDGAKNVEVIFKVKAFSNTESNTISPSELDHADLIARAVGNPL